MVVLAAALRYWLWYFDRSTNLLDEGSTAAQALRILNGDLIYRDFFTVVTPGWYYTVASLFQIFGEQLMVLRWAALVTGLAIALVTLAIGRQIASWPFAAAAALMTTVWGWFLITPNFYSLQAALFALIALFLHLRDAADPRTRWVVLAGVLTGLTALVKQNVGAYVAVGLLLSIWASRAFETTHRFPRPVAPQRALHRRHRHPGCADADLPDRFGSRPLSLRELGLLPAHEISGSIRAAVSGVLPAAARAQCDDAARCAAGAAVSRHPGAGGL